MHPALPYKWKQTLQDVTVTIPVPQGTKSKMLVVDIKKTHLKVGVKGEQPIIDDTLCKEVRIDDSTWTLGKWRKSCQASYQLTRPENR